MIVAHIKVSGVHATCTRRVTIPAGLRGGKVSIEYLDPVWNSMQKTVVFRGCVTKDVLNVGTLVEIPREVVAVPGADLYFGIEGTTPDGSLIIPLIEAHLGKAAKATDPSGDITTEDSLPVWQQILLMIGSLDDLTTNAKTTLVAAINEAAKKGGGSVDEETVWQIVDEYLTANPPQVNVPTKLSELENDSGFVTRVVSDLQNYYAKSQTYTKDEINSKISAIPKFSIKAVNSLPTNNISETTVYLLSTGSGSDLYTEYIHVGGKWEVLGSQRVDLTGYATEDWVGENYQPKGEYLIAVPAGYATEEYVRNKIAEAELGGEDVDLSGYAQKSELPTKVSQLENDAGYAKGTDIPTKPSDIGAQPEGDYALKAEIPAVPVKSVNGQTGDVRLDAAAVGARPDSWMPTASDVGALPASYVPPNQTAQQVGADPVGTASSTVAGHNTDTASHEDIRLLLKSLSDRLTAFFDSDEKTLDELSEIVEYITANRDLIDSITTSKVSVADIVNNLTTNVSNKPLSAAQGVVLAGLINTLSNSLSGYQPKGEYALRSELPSVPVKSVNNKTGDVKVTASDVGADPAGTAANAVSAHNQSQASHPDIRQALNQLSENKADKVTTEPLDDDIPKVFLSGDEFSNMTTEKNEVNMELDYRSKTDSFHAYIVIKYQGDSSLSYDKKNFTVKLFDDEARANKQKHLFRDWKYAKHKFVLKANYIDHSHARNIMGARLWSEVVASRADYDTLPEELRNSPMNGAIDGFPVKLYVNGTYQGIYTLNIGKDDWMWGMDEDNANHILMCAESNSNDIYRETPCNFRTTWDGTDGDKWSVEVGTNGSAVKTSINNLITFIKNNDGASFKTGIGTYLDVQSAIDYYIHHYVICGLDGLGKNMLLGTYNGQKWHCGSYDMDSTFGLYWNGSKFVSAAYRCPEDYQEKCGLLWERLEANFWAEIKTRYSELRKTVYSVSNMFTHFERFMDAVGLDLYAEDLTIFADIPNGDTNNIKQLRDFIRDRLVYCDQQILNGVPGKGVTLSKTELTLKTETATLTATASPSNTTDEIIWLSSNKSVATVDNGVVTPVADGSCTIRAKCGSGWGVCNVTVSAVVEPEPQYTNLVPTSIDTDRTIFNGVGYQHNKRLSSSGVLKDADEYNVATGFIEAKGGDIIRISGYTWYDTTSDMNYLCGYKPDFGFLYAANSKGSYQTTSLIESMSLVDGVSVVKLKDVSNLEFIRISLKNPSAAVNGANLIVTKNEEIT